jgi:uncharacterized membrane protein YqgA involved in biofilm formation
VTGTWVNVLAIVAGGVAGLTLRRGIPPPTQGWLKLVLAVLTVYFGLRLTWVSLSGSVGSHLLQVILVMVALGLGRVTGRLLRLQEGSNAAGRYARERMESALRTGGRAPWTDGFVVCTALYCVAPLAFLGPVAEALGRDSTPLFLKAAMDGLATMGFVKIWGPGVMLAALPVLAFQGTLTLLLLWAEPGLTAVRAAEAVSATCGLLVFCVALLILEVRRIEVTGYLPSLAWAALLAWWLGWGGA